MAIIGLDPGKRNVGICLLREGADPLFHEIRPKEEDLVGCLNHIEQRLDEFIFQNLGTRTFAAAKLGTTFCIERQLSVGGESSSLMFCIQMLILKEICDPVEPTNLIMPLPVQLRSYIKKMHGGDVSTASATVNHFKQQLNWKGRISQHCVDAYYLAKAGQDVLAGRWEYRLPANEAQLFHGNLINVSQRRLDRASEEAPRKEVSRHDRAVPRPNLK